MIAARITCPRCGQELTVTEAAPPQVSCPRCLAALVNPASPYSGVPRPVPVLPLDQQVAHDTRTGTYLTYGLIALIAVGSLFTFLSGTARNGTFILLLAGGLATFLYFLGQIRADTAATPSEPSADSYSDPSRDPGPGQSRVLEYGRPRGSQRPAATPGAVAGGFFSAIAVCGLGFLVLGSTADYSGRRSAGGNYNALILAAVVLAVIVFIVMTVRISGRWRGFGPGATAGLCLGLLALGPCAACYLLTLG